MTLKYEVGDVVVLGDSVDVNYLETFVPGAIVEIVQLCCVDQPEDAHYEVKLVEISSSQWWVKDDEINHEATALLQMSNESGYLVQKISVENDVVSSAVNTSDNQPKAQDNSWYENGELPPVNTKCIFTGTDIDVDGVIITHMYSDHYGVSALIQCDGDWWTGEVGEFKPLISEEDLKAQERERTIEKMREVCRSSEGPADAFEALYEAGLRFVEEE